MSFFDDINPFKAAGTVAGGIAGNVAGFPGMILGGLAGNRVGGGVGSMLGFGNGGGNAYGGMPGGYPAYVGMEPGDLAISGRFGGPNAPLDKFARESLRNDLAPGTRLALQMNTEGANTSRDQARRLASGMGKDAQAQLSMKGGLGAGAAERINKYSTNVGMDAAQAADAAAGGNRANLMIADESARNGNLAQAAGLVGQDSMNKYNMASGDLKRQQEELARRNAYNMNFYNQQMAGWAAGKQADATANSGKK